MQKYTPLGDALNRENPISLEMCIPFVWMGLYFDGWTKHDLFGLGYTSHRGKQGEAHISGVDSFALTKGTARKVSFSLTPMTVSNLD